MKHPISHHLNHLSRKLRLSPVLFSATLLLFSCSETIETNSTDGIYGSWDWKVSDGGFTGSHYTPDSTGYTCRMNFIRPNTCRVYKNNSLAQEVPFTFIHSFNKMMNEYYLFLGDSTDQAKFTQNFPLVVSGTYAYMLNDTLYTSDGIADGLTSMFVKVK
jgi:hypothetical protein